MNSAGSAGVLPGCFRFVVRAFTLVRQIVTQENTIMDIRTSEGKRCNNIEFADCWVVSASSFASVAESFGLENAKHGCLPVRRLDLFDYAQSRRGNVCIMKVGAGVYCSSANNADVCYIYQM